MPSPFASLTRLRFWCPEMDAFPELVESGIDVPGMNLARFADFFDRACPGEIRGSLRAHVIAGGKSNITYQVTDGERTWIVRRPPLGHVLATAHDMSREYRVITALEPTDVPVPRTFALCEDPSVLGEPFYVMEKVDGTAYRMASQLVPLGARRTELISTRVVETLLTLHAVDPAEVGLSDFGRPEGFLARQVRRWQKQLDASRHRDLVGADELQALLEAQLPPEGSVAVVHGDFRLDNLLVDDQDHVAAVIDWEMATIGDPLTDVALLYVYQRLADIAGGDSVSDASKAPGFISAEDALRIYADGSSLDTSSMGFYLGLAFFKLAVVLEGIHKRYVDGQTVGEGFDSVGSVVDPLISEGIRAMKEHR